jgi:DNA repair exonuclease SbcCD ATPase subunit
MAYAKRLSVRNYFSFRGDHAIDLEPTVYGVTASMIEDKERSNWVGKTSFVTAFPFALLGYQESRTAEGWITRGEKDGYVDVLMSDGCQIRRARERGHATRLTVTPPGQNAIFEAAAEEHLRARYRVLSEDDLFATSFFRQKQMGRILTMKPTERMEIVTSWLDLGALQASEADCNARATAASKEADRLRFLIAENEKRLKELEAAPAELAACEQAVKVSTMMLEEAQAQVAAGADRHRLEAEAVEFERLNARGLALKAEFDSLELSTEEESARFANHLAKRREIVAGVKVRLQQANTGARGEFDGKCPVAGIECPAKAQINEAGKESAELVAGLQRTLGTEWADLEQLEAEAATDREAHARAAKIAAELEVMRPRALALVGAAERLAALGGAASDAPGQALDLAKQALQMAQRSEAEAAARCTELGTLSALVATRREQLEALDREARLMRTGALVVGRNGAQRAVAVGAMAAIEQGANDLLETCGIELQLEVKWAREGNGPAKQCDKCGAGYPTSAKVKTCATCGAPRGQHLVERLDIEPSDISGAALDLGGIGFQLGASSWLREKRQSTWGIGVLDEPFGALDAAHKRALASHLSNMLRGRQGFEQAFVVAHDAGIMAALPARIELIGTEEGTRIAG